VFHFKKESTSPTQKELLLLLMALCVGGLAFDDDIFNLRKCFHYTYSLNIYLLNAQEEIPLESILPKIKISV
jgi:hypothetical protein